MSIDIKRAKIAKLLAKAEGTDNEAERDTYTEKAEKLMIAYGIEIAELEAAGEVKAEDIVEVRRTFTGGLSIVMIPFTQSIVNGFGNLRMLQATGYADTPNGWKPRSAYIIGHKSDVEMVSILINSLEAQALSALAAWRKTDPYYKHGTAAEKRVASRSFVTGFGNEVGRRLRAARTEATAEANVTPGASLVLVGKQERVDEKLHEMYPRLRTARVGARRYDYSGAAAGRTAGASANIGGKSLGGARQAVRS